MLGRVQLYGFPDPREAPMSIRRALRHVSVSTNHEAAGCQTGPFLVMGLRRRYGSTNSRLSAANFGRYLVVRHARRNTDRSAGELDDAMLSRHRIRPRA